MVDWHHRKQKSTQAVVASVQIVPTWALRPVPRESGCGESGVSGLANSNDRF